MFLNMTQHLKNVALVYNSQRCSSSTCLHKENELNLNNGDAQRKTHFLFLKLQRVMAQNIGTLGKYDQRRL